MYPVKCVPAHFLLFDECLGPKFLGHWVYNADHWFFSPPREGYYYEHSVLFEAPICSWHSWRESHISCWPLCLCNCSSSCPSYPPSPMFPSPIVLPISWCPDGVPPLSSAFLDCPRQHWFTNVTHFIANTNLFKSSSKYIPGISNSKTYFQVISNLFIWFHPLNCKYFEGIPVCSNNTYWWTD